MKHNQRKRELLKFPLILGLSLHVDPRSLVGGLQSKTCSVIVCSEEERPPAASRMFDVYLRNFLQPEPELFC